MNCLLLRFKHPKRLVLQVLICYKSVVSGEDANVRITGNIDYFGNCAGCAFHTADECPTATATGG